MDSSATLPSILSELEPLSQCSTSDSLRWFTYPNTPTDLDVAQMHRQQEFYKKCFHECIAILAQDLDSHKSTACKKLGVELSHKLLDNLERLSTRGFSVKDFVAECSSCSTKLLSDVDGEEHSSQLTEEDLLEARYSELFLHPRVRPARTYHFEYFDSLLSEQEKAKLLKHNIVVSERLGADSFVACYYNLYSNDLPVFITSDSILHAWHRSFDSILVQLEQWILYPLLEEYLNGMLQGLQVIADRNSSSPSLMLVVRHCTILLEAARNQLSPGDQVNLSVVQEAREDSTFLKILEKMEHAQSPHTQETFLEELTFCGKERLFDFSQLKVRGHYVKNDRLQRFFRATMLLYLGEFRVAGGDEENDSDPLQLAAALLLSEVSSKDPALSASLSSFNAIVQALFGVPNNLTLLELEHWRVESGHPAISGVLFDPSFEWEQLSSWQDSLLRSGHTAPPVVCTPYVKDPLQTSKRQRPLTVSISGQGVGVDSWALSRLVWDQTKDMRRVPSILDVAFSVFGRNDVAPLLGKIMASAEGANAVNAADVTDLDAANGCAIRFHHGRVCHRELKSVRAAIDTMTEAQWSESVFTRWLAVLRSLSVPDGAATDSEMFQSPAWNSISLNSQLGSWTQLRHDSVLHIVQSGGAIRGCDYPGAAVEPRIEFWKSMQNLAKGLAVAVAQMRLPEAEQVSFTVSSSWGSWERDIVPKQVQKRVLGFLVNFQSKMGVLEGIATKQSRREKSITAEEAYFLRSIVEHIPHGSGGDWKYGGWYPNLFFENEKDGAVSEDLVADYHTNYPDTNVGDPGCVMHTAVRGKVNLMICNSDRYLDVAADLFHNTSRHLRQSFLHQSGVSRSIDKRDRAILAGPVFAHHHFAMDAGSRLTDEEYTSAVAAGAAKFTRTTAWMKSILVAENDAVKLA